jgi:hypothetical protein
MICGLMLTVFDDGNPGDSNSNAVLRGRWPDRRQLSALWQFDLHANQRMTLRNRVLQLANVVFQDFALIPSTDRPARLNNDILVHACSIDILNKTFPIFLKLNWSLFALFCNECLQEKNKIKDCFVNSITEEKNFFFMRKTV